MAVTGIKNMRICNYMSERCCFRCSFVINNCCIPAIIDTIYVYIISPRDFLQPTSSNRVESVSHLIFVAMSQPPSPTSLSHLSSLEVQDDSPQRSAISDSARQERLAALARRLSPPREDAQAATLVPQDLQPFDANHAKRNEFRRLVDPGIVRPNSKEVVLRSLRVNLISSFAPLPIS